MSQFVPPKQSEPQPVRGGDSPDIMSFWRRIRHRKKLMVMITLHAMMVAAIMSVLTPKSYQSTALLLPQIESMEGGFGLASILGRSGGINGVAKNLGVSLPGAPATDVELFLAILKSRTIADALIQKFNLQEVYETELMVDTRKALANNTSITMTKEKAIKIVVEDTSPQRAADLANSYMSELDRLNQTLNVSKASNSRRFIANQLKETAKALYQSEEALKEFQASHKAFAMEKQSHALIEAAATIQGQLTAQQVQLEVMNTYLSQNNPEIDRVRSSINELRKQLTALDTGKNGDGVVRGSRLHPSITAVPDLALQYVRLLRDVKVQETLFEVLSAEYEQSRYQEARNTPTVEILDLAVPAERKSHPITTLNTLMGGIIGFILSILLSLWLEHRDRKKASPTETVLEMAA